MARGRGRTRPAPGAGHHGLRRRAARRPARRRPAPRARDRRGLVLALGRLRRLAGGGAGRGVAGRPRPAARRRPRRRPRRARLHDQRDRRAAGRRRARRPARRRRRPRRATAADGRPGALADDPLRTLRAVRLAVELELEIEPATGAAVTAHAPALARVSPERVFAELKRIVVAPAVLRGMALLAAHGLDGRRAPRADRPARRRAERLPPRRRLRPHARGARRGRRARARPGGRRPRRARPRDRSPARRAAGRRAHARRRDALRRPPPRRRQARDPRRAARRPGHVHRARPGGRGARARRAAAPAGLRAARRLRRRAHPAPPAPRLPRP